MIIIFDLDYTLLDTIRFKEKLADIFIKQDFYADYEKYFKDKRVNFNYNKYLSILKSEDRINSAEEKKLRRQEKKLMQNLDDYLFPGVKKVLKYFKESGAKLILITFGDKEWHTAKVKNLAIKKYFDIIAFEDKDKAKSRLLKTLSRSRQRILIVNDNAGEIKQMVKILGSKAEVILLAGPYARIIKHNWPIRQWKKLNFKKIN